VFCGFLSRSWDNWNFKAVREGGAGSPILRLTGPALVATFCRNQVDCKNRRKRFPSPNGPTKPRRVSGRGKLRSLPRSWDNWTLEAVREGEAR